MLGEREREHIEAVASLKMLPSFSCNQVIPYLQHSSQEHSLFRLISIPTQPPTHSPTTTTSPFGYIIYSYEHPWFSTRLFFFFFLTIFSKKTYCEKIVFRYQRIEKAVPQVYDKKKCYEIKSLLFYSISNTEKKLCFVQTSS